MLPAGTIINGDNVEVLRSFDDGCIDLTVTSPPYDTLRSYGGFLLHMEEIRSP
jgi:DNA modification methylase